MAESSPPDTTRLVEKVLAKEFDQICALCLSEHGLHSVSHAILLVDGGTEHEASVLELLTSLQLISYYDLQPLSQICSECLVKVSNWYLFKKNCTKTALAFKNFTHTVLEVYKEASENSSKRRKTTRLMLPYENIMDYANLKEVHISVPRIDASVYETDPLIKDEPCEEIEGKSDCPKTCKDCVDTFKNMHELNPEESHSCNICDATFETHKDTTDHLLTHDSSEMTADGIKTMKLKETHRQVVERILQGRPFCCCCLHESSTLLNVSDTECGLEGVTLEDVLRQVLKTEEVDRFSPMWICSQCTKRALTAHTLLVDFHNSTQVLNTCLTQLQQCIVDGKSASEELSLKCNKKSMPVKFLQKKESNLHTLSPEINSNSLETFCEKTVNTRAKELIYDCTKCDAMFATRRKCVAHKKAHLQSDPHVCRFCKMIFNTVGSLRMHLRRSHADVYRGAYTLKHFNVHSVAKVEFSCTQCDETFPAYHLFDKHRRTHSKTDPHVCKYCNVQFDEVRPLRCHIRNEHFDVFTSPYTALMANRFGIENKVKTRACLRCDKTFRVRQYRRHVKTHNESDPYICRVCGQKFTNYGQVTFHRMKKHPQTISNAKKKATVYECSRCDQYFLTRPKRCQHFRQTHKESDPHICNMCGKTFTALMTMKAHQWNDHPNVAYCAVCRNVFLKSELSEHIERDHLYKKYCDECGTHFYTKSALIHHIRSKHNPKLRYVCKICNMRFTRKGRLEAHMKSCAVEEKQFTCSICSNHYPTHASLENHKCISFKCVRCGLCFPTEMLEDHVCTVDTVSDDALTKQEIIQESEHIQESEDIQEPQNVQELENIQKPEHTPEPDMDEDDNWWMQWGDGMSEEIENARIRCYICGKIFSSMRYWSQHMESHETPKLPLSQSVVKDGEKTTKKKRIRRLMCDCCGKLFLYTTELANHVITHNRCPTCREMVPKKDLDDHLATHPDCRFKRKTTPKTVECNNCDYTCTDKQLLELHINSLHMLQQPYTCDKCGKNFYSKKTCVMHQKTHTDWTDSCKSCGKIFKTPVGLTLHMRSHTGEKNYTCDICQESFVSQSRLTTHKKKYHFEPEFACPVCSKRFTFAAGLRKHIQIHMKPRRGKLEQVELVEYDQAPIDYV